MRRPAGRVCGVMDLYRVCVSVETAGAFEPEPIDAESDSKAMDLSLTGTGVVCKGSVFKSGPKNGAHCTARIRTA